MNTTLAILAGIALVESVIYHAIGIYRHAHWIKKQRNKP